ncbi:MAG: type II secretion system protein GspG [Oligoflexales bacterium]
MKFLRAGRRGERGMTLLEIVMVVALLGTLMTILIRSITDTADSAMEDEARLAMGNIAQALQIYKIHNRKYPASLEDLVDNVSGTKGWRGPYIEKNKLADPWDSAFEYESDGFKFEIRSAGKDQALGTDKDIVYPEPEDTGDSES